MDAIVDDIIPYLEKGGIKYRKHGTRIRVPLPGGFGELEIGDLGKGDSILGLVDESWHTHGDVLIHEEGGNTEAEAIYLFINRIFEGKYLLVEEFENGKPVRRTIEENLKRYYNYMPKGVEIKIYNET